MLALAGWFFEIAARFRRAAVRQRIKQRHPNVRALRWDPISSLIGYPHLTVGRNVSIGGNAFISGPVTFGDHVMIAPYCALLAGAHRFDVPGRVIRYSGGAPARGIVIERDVWLGHGVTVIDGVRISEGSVIAAGSLVTKDVPSYTINAGVPCKPVRPRFSEDEMAEHKRLLGQPSVGEREAG